MADDLMKRIAELVADGDDVESVKLVKQAIAEGHKPLYVLTEGASKGMDIISAAYDEGEAYLPELVLSGDAMSAVIAVIFASMDEAELEASKQGTVVIGQAKGDVHDIGKNVVSALLAINGFTVIDLGIDVDVKTFYQKAIEHDADIVAMSTLLTTSLPFMEDAMHYFTDTGIRNNFFYILGGGPVTPEFAQNLKVDGWARTAFDCVALCKSLMADKKPGSGETMIVDSEVM